MKFNSFLENIFFYRLIFNDTNLKKNIIEFAVCVLVLSDDDEIIELVPNIILNPAYDVEQLELDENFNDHFAMRMNNNTVIQPVRV